MRTLVRRSILLLFLVLAWTASAAAEDSCDLAVLPAATLLLPYFEVDLDDPGARTTLFTIANVTNTDAVARVTLWTDRGYPVFTFNVFLTGYDVQALSLYDLLAQGVIAAEPIPRGEFSDPNPTLGACGAAATRISEEELARIRSAFTAGTIGGACDAIGGAHENAIGYATIDVVGNCANRTPRDAGYWSEDLRYDNILTGDYQQLEGESARGGPLVHIRALAQPGARTFYARYTNGDRRQPLPARFAARWTEDSSLTIWREGRAGRDAQCGEFASEEDLAVADVVVFDEQENGIGLTRHVQLPVLSKTSVADPRFPQLPASSGWMYVNLDRSRRDDFASQAWVVDAIPLGNGCAPPVDDPQPIAPAPAGDSCDVAELPAATLLLPYFEVDVDDPHGETTILTVTNVSAEDRIARVTLWTDFAFPALTFNVFLTGYDVQRIDLYDVIAHGAVAPTSRTADRGDRSKRNFALDLDACGNAGGQLDETLITRMKAAFRSGRVPALGTRPGCSSVGNEHENAVGYATIDVVRNCALNEPLSAEYWTEDLAYDNVLIGDYEHRETRGSLVHIRAVTHDVERTFYARYQPASAPKLDRRQPLPSVFAARWIEGTAAGFDTDFTIWREGPVGGDGTCQTWRENFARITEIVRFDENENAVGEVPETEVFPPCHWETCAQIGATARLAIHDNPVPPLPNAAPAGWLYLNLDHEAPWAAQSWMIASMRSAAGHAVDVPATALGNGCSPAMPLTEVTIGTAVIGPRP